MERTRRQWRQAAGKKGGLVLQRGAGKRDEVREVAAHCYTPVCPSLAGLSPLTPWSLLHAAGLHMFTGSSSQHT
jgi:hypothetical protein